MTRVKHPEFGDEFPTTEAILKLLAAGAILTMSILVPVFPIVAASFLGPWKDFDRRRLKDQITRLKKRKLISIVEKNGETVVALTDRGKLRVLRYNLLKLKISKPKNWDGRWRLIIFDVIEKKKRLRDAFREMVKRLGFYRLQKSVFVYPYQCKDEVEFLRQIYGVGDEVLYLTVDYLEDQEELKAHFNL
ncbi:CRISPR-associated endonuclease Cas2 [Candidatus Gottesmanbacteria bacterium]|nr:CRISPR-associated endonuclease Cas2 [Candidatus Gottesmanbacteria bacterium]